MADQATILLILMATFLMITVQGYSGGYSATSDAMIAFFFNPGTMLIYVLILFSTDWFFNWMPGSILLFAIGGAVYLIANARGI